MDRLFRGCYKDKNDKIPISNHNRNSNTIYVGDKISQFCLYDMIYIFLRSLNLHPTFYLVVSSRGEPEKRQNMCARQFSRRNAASTRRRLQTAA